LFPVGRFDDAGNDIEREDPLGPSFRSVDVKGDPHSKKTLFGRFLPPDDLLPRKRPDPVDQDLRPFARRAVILEDLIEKPARIVGFFTHVRPLGKIILVLYFDRTA